MIQIEVELQTTKGKSRNQVSLAGSPAAFTDLLMAIEETAWGKELFDPQASPAKLLPGFLLVLDNRMVQPWEMEDRPVANGQKLKIVQVVPGG